MRSLIKGPTTGPWHDVWRLGLIVLLTLLAYSRLATDGFVWNDRDYVTQPELRSVGGMRRIWFEVGATQQYYPVLHSAFWLEHRLWGNAARGYHLANVLLHAGSACLFFLILRRLSIPGAWLAGLIFALHPVCVESVAWVSEQKNTLSTIFYLAAALAYLRWREETGPGGPEGRDARPGFRPWIFYAIASLLFVLAILSKSMAATLPAALLVVCWWKSGHLSPRRDALPLVPWFATGAAVGLFTAWVERTYVGAEGRDFALSAVQRILVAGRAVWFYLAKLIWPSPLVFIYPRWTVDAHALWQFGFPFGAAVATAFLWMIRGRFRGPLAAWLLFVGTLFPILGFFNVYAFIYSFVADHWQYLASLGVIALAAASLARAAEGMGPGLRTLLGAALIGTLGTLTWRQCGAYRDVVTFYQAIINGNPACWMAHNNLGIELLALGRPGEAELEFRAVVTLRPDDADAHNNLASALSNLPGRLNDAVVQCKEALRLRPNYAEGHNNLGNAWFKLGRLTEAVAEYQEALRLSPDYAEARYNLGNAWLETPGRLNQAVAEFKESLRLDPDNAEAHYNLGNALERMPGRRDEAFAQFEETLRLKPDFAGAHNNLGIILKAEGRRPEAISQFEQALRLNPDDAQARNNLGNALNAEGRKQEAIAQYEWALRLKPDFIEAHYNLGKTLETTPGRLKDAIVELEEALRLKPDSAVIHFNLAIALLKLSGRKDEAEAQLEAVLRLEPENETARRILAKIRLSQP